MKSISIGRARLVAWLMLLAATVPAEAQVIFGSLVNSPDGPVSAIFEVNNGNVTGVNTGLPNNQFPGLSRDGTQLTISSPDPQQPFEASWDLFAFDRTTGQTRKLVDNQTQSLPDGGFIFSQPLFSHTSANGQWVAYVNQVSSNNPDQQGGSFRFLHVIRASDGFPLSQVEIGHGNTVDFYQSEFVGISWSPNAPVFAAPAYVPANEQQMVAAGIVLFGEVGGGQFGRVGQLTQPSVSILPCPPCGFVTETHAFPAFSPSGQRLAFFRITYTANLTQPALADLIVIDLAGGQPPVQLAAFDPGIFPAGLTWSSDGGQVVFAVGAQAQQSGLFLPIADPTTAVLRTVAAAGGPIGQIPGAPAGFMPSGVPPANVIFRSNFSQ